MGNLDTVKDIPIEKLYDHPVVQQLLSKIDGDLESSVKIPYLIKEKILMSPGVWNGYFYSSDSIKDAFLQSEWNKKEIRSLFLDHEDLKSKEWIGEIVNPRIEDDTIIADLIIVDKPTAMKLAYGAKMGVSPKVSGKEDDGTMMSFKFDNFSVVINPAVKTAYINNAQKEEMAVAKPYGDVAYADPGYRDNKARYPIDTEKHVRAAWSYIHQPDNRKDYTADQLKAIEAKIGTAAVKFKIDLKNQEVKKMTEEEKPVEPKETPVEPATNEETTAEVENKEAPVVETPVKEVAKKMEEEVKPEEPKPAEVPAPAPAEEPAPAEPVPPVEEAPKEMADMKYTEFIMNFVKENSTATPAEAAAAWNGGKALENSKVVKDNEEAIKKMSDQLSEKDKVISEMSERLQKVEDKLNEPDKASTKTAEMSQSMNEDPDRAFMNLLQAC